MVCELFYKTRKFGLCVYFQTNGMSNWKYKSSVLIAPSVEYDSTDELQSACDGLVDIYYEILRVAITRIWFKRTSGITSLHDINMMSISSFDDVLSCGVHYLQLTMKGKGGLYAHSMNGEIIRRINSANHLYFYTLYKYSLDDLLRHVMHTITDVIVHGERSHFTRVFHENFCTFIDDEIPWLICPTNAVVHYKTAVLMSQHRRLGHMSHLGTLSDDILDYIIHSMLYVVSPKKNMT